MHSGLNRGDKFTKHHRCQLAPIMREADDSLEYFFLCFFFLFFFSEIIRLDIADESSARQRINMKHQALLASKHKSKKIKCRLLQFCLALSGLYIVINDQPLTPFTSAFVFWQDPVQSIVVTPVFLKGSPQSAPLVLLLLSPTVALPHT